MWLATMSIKQNQWERQRTLRAIWGLRRWSMATESACFLFWRSEEAEPPSLRFKVPSEVGVRMPERGRDASAPGRTEEDMYGERS